MALAFVTNLDAWGTFCARTAAGLRQHYGLDDRAVAFFDFFATPPPNLEARAVAVVQAGLEAGDDLQRARLRQSKSKISLKSRFFFRGWEGAWS